MGAAEFFHIFLYSSSNMFISSSPGQIALGRLPDEGARSDMKRACLLLVLVCWSYEAGAAWAGAKWI